MRANEAAAYSDAERTRRRLRKAGGSKAVTLPKSWLQRAGIEDEVELVEGREGILVLPVRRERSIEDEPEFAEFLAFVARDALGHPEALGDMAELVDGNEELFSGVEVEE